jgi:hypothetical protein
MRTKATGILLAGLVLALAAAAGAVLRPAPLASETRWALVVNETSDTVFLTYTEIIDGMTVKSQGPVYAGRSKRLDAAAIQGEVCAWTQKEFKPTQKLACRELKPGETWIIH